MTDDLEAKIKALEAKIAALEAKANQPPQGSGWIEPRPMAQNWSTLDRTAAASMPPSALAALVNGVDEGVMAGLRGDALRRSPANGPASMAVKPSAGPSVDVVRGTGWVNAAPISQPPGVNLIDKITERFVGPPHGPKPKSDVAGE